MELEWMGFAPRVYCPACGMPIVEEDMDSEICEHVLFMYSGLSGEFEHVSPDIEDLAEQAKEIADEEHSDPAEELIKLLNERQQVNSVLCFSITTSGMACGPISSTECFAIDFCMSDEFDDDESE